MKEEGANSEVMRRESGWFGSGDKGVASFCEKKICVLTGRQELVQEPPGGPLKEDGDHRKV